MLNIYFLKFFYCDNTHRRVHKTKMCFLKDHCHIINVNYHQIITANNSEASFLPLSSYSPFLPLQNNHYHDFHGICFLALFIAFLLKTHLPELYRSVSPGFKILHE